VERNIFFFGCKGHLFSWCLLLHRLLRQQPLERRGRDVRDDGVEVLALAAALGGLGDLALNAHANAPRDALDAAAPKEVVERRVDAVVLGAQQSVREGADLLDRGRRALVEGAALQHLGEVHGALVRDGVVLALGLAEEEAAGDAAARDLLERGVLRLLGGRHLREHALPALVVARAACGDGLAAVSNNRELLLLAENLALGALADHSFLLAKLCFLCR